MKIKFTKFYLFSNFIQILIFKYILLNFEMAYRARAVDIKPPSLPTTQEQIFDV